MKTRRVIANLAAVGLLAVFVAAIWWTGRPLVRREVYSEPLLHPIAVRSINAQGVHLADGRVLRIAGLSWPRPPADRSAMEVAGVFCTQGVEAAEVFADGTATFTVEARVNHRCGNDPVAAHYDRWDLAELMVGTGFVTVDGESTGLSVERLERLVAFEKFAQQRRERRGAPKDRNWEVNQWGLRPGLSGELKEFRRGLGDGSD